MHICMSCIESIQNSRTSGATEICAICATQILKQAGLSDLELKYGYGNVPNVCSDCGVHHWGALRCDSDSIHDWKDKGRG
jgi:hypothetical protein